MTDSKTDANQSSNSGKKALEDTRVVEVHASEAAREDSGLDEHPPAPPEPDIDTTELAAVEDPWQLLGTMIGDWCIDACIASNDFCTTYRARLPEGTAATSARMRAGGSRVCIRVFSSFADTPEAEREPLMASFDEVHERLARLHAISAYATAVVDHGVIEDEHRWLPYMAFEWVDGRPLLDVLLEETQAGATPRDASGAMSVLSGPAAALEAAHDLGIVHLDLKPENILVAGGQSTPLQALKLLDFGMTRLVTGIGEGERNRPREAAITPEYAAPEQYDPTYGPIGPQTDVFAFALVLLEIMRGGRSVLGAGLEFDMSGIAEMRRRATDKALRPTPHRLGLDVSPEVEAVFARALAVDPRKRQANMGAFRQLLAAAIDRGARSSSLVPSPPLFGGGHDRDASVNSPASTLTGLPLSDNAPTSAPPANTDEFEEFEEFEEFDNSKAGAAQANMAAAQSSARGKRSDAPPFAQSGEIIADGRTISSVRIDPDYAELLANEQADAGSERLYGERSSFGKLWGFARAQPLATVGLVALSMLLGLGLERVWSSSHADEGTLGGAAGGMQGVAPASLVPEKATVPPPPPEPVGPSCPEGMALVPGGKYFMGSDSEHRVLASARPAHQVSLEPYCIDIHEVSVADYRHCSKVGECKRAHRTSLWPKGRMDDRDWRDAREAHSHLCNENADETDEERKRHPVNCVTWRQADAYCKFVGKRLPRESEWEFAARGSDGRVFPWGDETPDHTRMNACGLECQKWREGRNLSPGRAMYEKDDTFAGTAPVGSFPAGKTQHGLHDMVGNVFEWTADQFKPYGDTDKSNKHRRNRQAKAPELGEKRVIRGGAFNSFVPEFSDPALRYGMAAKAHTHVIGFRCASEIIPGDGPRGTGVPDPSGEPPTAANEAAGQ